MNAFKFDMGTGKSNNFIADFANHGKPANKKDAHFNQHLFYFCTHRVPSTCKVALVDTSSIIAAYSASSSRVTLDIVNV